MSANRHVQTSTHPVTGKFMLNLYSEKIALDLDAPGSSYQTTPEGFLVTLSFQKQSVYYYVTFHPTTEPADERVASVQRFESAGDLMVLSGASHTYSPDGQLLSESNWQNGRMEGAQRRYFESGMVLDECFYEGGFPVKTWTAYFDHGNKATEIVFPASLEEWSKTRLGDNDQSATSVMTLPYNHPIAIHETWFSENGTKQRERSLNAYKDDTQVVMDPTGDEKYFDAAGAVIRTVSRDNNLAKDRRVVEVGGLRFHIDARSIDGRALYRSEYRSDAR